MRKFIKTHVTYDVIITTKELIAISNKDLEADVTLYLRLNKISGVSGVDYDMGYINKNITLTLESNLDNEKTKEEIIKTIEDYLQ